METVDILEKAQRLDNKLNEACGDVYMDMPEYDKFVAQMHEVAYRFVYQPTGDGREGYFIQPRHDSSTYYGKEGWFYLRHSQSRDAKISIEVPNVDEMASSVMLNPDYISMMPPPEQQEIQKLQQQLDEADKQLVAQQQMLDTIEQHSPEVAGVIAERLPNLSFNVKKLSVMLDKMEAKVKDKLVKTLKSKVEEEGV